MDAPARPEVAAADPRPVERPGPCLTGVGVGPGDPAQVTVEAVAALTGADHVLAPSSSPESVGRAESVVRQVCPGVRVRRVVIPMDGSPCVDPYESVARTIADLLDGEARVAFATLGDPNVYSTFTSVVTAVRRLRSDTDVRTVAGIMAFQALAAATGTVVVTGAQSLTLLTALDGAGVLDASLADPDRAVVVYKGGRHFPEIAKKTAAAGRLDGAVAGELLGLPGERVRPLGDIADEPSAYLSTIIVPARREVRP